MHNCWLANVRRKAESKNINMWKKIEKSNKRKGCSAFIIFGHVPKVFWHCHVIDRYSTYLHSVNVWIKITLWPGHLPHVSLMRNLIFVVLPVGSRPRPQPTTGECASLNDVIDIFHGEDHDCKRIWNPRVSLPLLTFFSTVFYNFVPIATTFCAVWLTSLNENT